MRIKIKPISNIPMNELCDWGKLTKALKAANGKAESHVADGSDVCMAAIDAEDNLNTLGILKKDRKGARFIYISGKPVTNAYSNKAWARAATAVSLERGANAWFAVDIKRTEIDQRGGSSVPFLTPAQAKIATDKFTDQFVVMD
jgi:hypothetical protein